MKNYKQRAYLGGMRAEQSLTSERTLGNPL
jgi:hypothetical protein